MSKLPKSDWHRLFHSTRKSDWHLALAEAIKTATPGETIQVHTEAMKELGERACDRMGRDDLKIVVSP